MTGFVIVRGPLPDESLDSWVHWMARELHSSPRSVAIGLGLEPTASPGYLNRDVTPAETEQIAIRVGCEPRLIVDSTLQRWSWLGLRPPRDKRGSPSGVWQRGSGARYCPSCLEEAAGRWPLEWYLQWGFLCTKHLVILSSACSDCGGVPRTARLGSQDLRPAQWGSLNCGCHRPSFGPGGRALNVGHPIADAQRAIQQLLASDSGLAPDMYVGGEAVHPRLWLADLSQITRSVLFALATDQGDRLRLRYSQQLEIDDDWFLDRDLVAITSTTSSARLHPAKVLGATVREPAALATAATIAIRVLESSDREELASSLMWMQPAWRVALQQKAAHGAVKVSPPLLSAIKEGVRETSRGWVAGLHHQHPVRIGATRYQSGAIDHRMFPACPHPAVRRRLSLIRGDVELAAVVMGLLTDGDVPEECEATAVALGLGHIAPQLWRTWRRLMFGEPRAEVLMIAASLLDPAYQSHPVDFGSRREACPAPADLPAEVIADLARELNTRRTAALELTAALYCWERITGTDALLSTRAIGLHGAYRMRYRRVRDGWHSQLPETLHRTLVEWAADHAIEPVRAQSQHGTAKDIWTEHSLTDPHLVPVRPSVVGGTVDDGDTRLVACAAPLGEARPPSRREGRT